MTTAQWQAEADRLTIAAAFTFDERAELLYWASQFALWAAME